MDVDRDVSTATLNNCRETTSAIFSLRTDEQNGRQPFERMPHIYRLQIYDYYTEENVQRSKLEMLESII